MTPMFVTYYYQSQNLKTCSRCKSPAQKNFCKKHLEEAKIAFRVWTVKRVAKKLCVCCNGHALVVKTASGAKRQGVYCRKHKERNRKRSLAWAQKYAVEIKMERWRRVFAGVCVNNPDHGRTYDGHTYCRTCFTRRATKT